ncbi:hypothetical protein ACFQ0M_10025 [Kitasatospora aburaviensis]
MVVEAAVAPSALDSFRRESRATGAALHYVVLRAPARPPTWGRWSAMRWVPRRCRGYRRGAGAADPASTAATVLTGLSQGTFLLGW